MCVPSNSMGANAKICNEMENSCKKKQRLMLDIETLSRDRERGLILEIALRPFDLGRFGGGMNWEFHRYITEASSRAHGRTVEDKTLDWWSTPERLKTLTAIRDRTKEEGEEWPRVLRDLYIELLSLDRMGYDLEIWSQGIDFDIPMIESGWMQLGIIQSWDDIPYRFYSKRDCRTVIALAKELGWRRPALPSYIIRHTALDDCKVQSLYLASAWEYLMKHSA